MTLFIRLFAIALTQCLFLVAASGQTPNKELRAVQLQISELHEQTQAFIDEDQIESALRNAQEAHRQSVEMLGPDSKITATLGLSLANLLAAVAPTNDALEYYHLSLQGHEKIYGEEGFEVVEVLAYMSEWLSGDEQVAFVKRALAIHKKHRPDSRLEFARLAGRIGGYLSYERNTRDESVPILKNALTILEAEYGRKSVELIPVLMSLGHAHAARRYKYPARQRHYYQRAIRIAKKAGDYDKRAELTLSAGVSLMELSKSGEALPFLMNAYKMYSKLYGVDDARTAYARLAWARYNAGQGRYGPALERLKKSFNVFRKNDKYRNHEMTALTLIVDAYENLGDRDSATTYCQAMGEITPWIDNQSMKPIFKRMPNFTRAVWIEGTHGKVTIEFTVDKYGFVTSPRVIENTGTALFETAALEATETFRYAPRFVDGKPVDTPNVTNTFEFKLGAHSRRYIENY